MPVRVWHAGLLAYFTSQLDAGTHGGRGPGRRFMLLEADAAETPWSRICVEQADCILLVAAEDAGPQARAPLRPRILHVLLLPVPR